MQSPSRQQFYKVSFSESSIRNMNLCVYGAFKGISPNTAMTFVLGSFAMQSWASLSWEQCPERTHIQSFSEASFWGPLQCKVPIYKGFAKYRFQHQASKT